MYNLFPIAACYKGLDGIRMAKTGTQSMIKDKLGTKNEESGQIFVIPGKRQKKLGSMVTSRGTSGRTA